MPAGIIPFNAPINLLIQKVVAPAIAAGNAIIVKPAPAGTRTALRVAELFERAGWPKGLFNVVTGDAIAAALVMHPDVRAVWFTGGTVAGDALARAAGAKKFLAESAPTPPISCSQMPISTAANKIAGAGFEASGQQCISAQRVLVQKSVVEAFPSNRGRRQDSRSGRRRSADRCRADGVGGSADRMMAMCEDAIKLGARYVLEPRR